MLNDASLLQLLRDLGETEPQAEQLTLDLNTDTPAS